MTSLPPPHVEHAHLRVPPVCDLTQPPAHRGGLDQQANEAGEQLSHRQGRYSMLCRQAVSEPVIVSHDRVKQTVYRLLFDAIHVEKRFTADQLAVASGVGICAIRSYMKGTHEERRECSLSKALSLAVVLGPRAVNTILALVGYGGAAPLDEVAANAPARATVLAIDGLSRFTKVAIDGRIDADEEREGRDAADLVIDALLPFSSIGCAA